MQQINNNLFKLSKINNFVKSYYKHLSSRMEYGENEEITKKPILRSSGIFPVVKNQNYSSRILFLGYWFIKRNIPEVGLIITLRDQKGKILQRKMQSIDSVKAFTIELDTILNLYNNHYLQKVECKQKNHKKYHQFYSNNQFQNYIMNNHNMNG